MVSWRARQEVLVSGENKVSLDDYTKEGPLLFFHAGDRSGVCTHQIGDRPEIGCAEAQRMEFPFLADFNRKEDYGGGHDSQDRTCFIDREGVESSTKDQPEVEAVLVVLDRAL
jgi:hypothetical protein